jgi:Tfp pilus assembly protein PilO
MAFVLTKKMVKILGVIGCVAIAGLGVNVAILPTINTINTANQSITDAQDSMTAMQSRVTTLEAAKTDYDKIKGINDELSAQFPENGQTQLLIEQLLASANNNGISSNNVTSISFVAPTIKTPPVAPAPTPTETEAPAAEGEEATPEEAPAADAAQTSVGDGYAVLEFSLSLTGTPAQVTGFLDTLNKLPRVVIIKETSFNAEGEGTVTLAFTAQTYVYQAIPEPAEVISEPTEG